MRLTEPARSSKEFDRRKAANIKALRKLCRENGIHVRTRAHSKAAERGASR